MAITLGGKAMVMRATFDAIARIEAGTGEGIVLLCQKYQRAEFGLAESALIVTEALKAGGEPGATYKEVGKMMFEEGLENFVAVIAQFLATALRGPSEGNGPPADEN